MRKKERSRSHHSLVHQLRRLSANVRSEKERRVEEQQVRGRERTEKEERKQEPLSLARNSAELKQLPKGDQMSPCRIQW